jgi:HicA toxin of bacterial toxin-antitoxin,
LRVLLYECVDVRLAASLSTVDVRTVADQDGLGISNGQLLALAAAEFDVFVTVDRNLPLQQLLGEDGWYLVSTRGGHRQFKHASKPGRVTVAGNQAVIWHRAL